MRHRRRIQVRVHAERRAASGAQRAQHGAFGLDAPPFGCVVDAAAQLGCKRRVRRKRLDRERALRDRRHDRLRIERDGVRCARAEPV